MSSSGAAKSKKHKRKHKLVDILADQPADTLVLKSPAATNGQHPEAPKEQQPLKLNLGCGKSKMEGFLGVDIIKFDSVDVVADLRERWPWEDGTVDEVHASHFLEHFSGMQRVHLMNELWRVLKEGSKAQIICPNWQSGRAYGDPSHVWPPMCGFYIYYLSYIWRTDNCPHMDTRWNPEGFSCHFDAQCAFILHQDVAMRSAEAQGFFCTFHTEAAQDVILHLTKLAIPAA